MLRAIAIWFLNIKARMEADSFAETNEEIDMRTVPASIKHGMIFNQEILDKRWNLCLGCEFLTDSNRCQECGCFMKVAHKLAWKACPIGKWDRYNITEGKVLNGSYTTT